MSKLRWWVCNLCGTFVVKVGKGFRRAHERHEVECPKRVPGKSPTYNIANDKAVKS